MPNRRLLILLAFLLGAAEPAASSEFFIQARLGVAHHAMDDELLNTVVYPKHYLVDRITGGYVLRAAPGGPDFGFGLSASFLSGIRVNEQWWLGVGAERLDVRNRSDGFFGGDVRENLSAWSLVAHVGREFHPPGRSFDVVPSLEVGVLTPSVDRRQGGPYDGSWSDRTMPTVTALVGIQHWLAHDAVLSIEGGYRYARGEHRDIELNYSGVLLRVGVRLVR